MFSLKQQKKETPSQSSAKPAPTKKSSSAHLRIAKDITELQIPKTCVLNFPDPDDLFNFKLLISPEEGHYKAGKFTFNFLIPSSYPFEPPKVKCETKVYHPNIDLEGSICLNILRESWNPVLNLEVVIIGLQHLFLEPNPEDPLNKEAASVLHTSPKIFAQHVESSIKGGYIGNSYWDGIPGCNNKKSYRY